MYFHENVLKDMKNETTTSLTYSSKSPVTMHQRRRPRRPSLSSREAWTWRQHLEIKFSNKTEEDIMKSWKRSKQAVNDLMCCVVFYHQAQSKWFEETMTTTLEM
ncbi:Growth arrest-specific protein 7 [Sciurus carolinensis]|uniref:Growth arrest-specific protein 7 n=1 Tax=Sciurus carolinensis TaxID=30640 RepID=A0AA41NFD1_SCICA|nr:Growth arrest-specific protein 7 [Sciurus carolinensis]